MKAADSGEDANFPEASFGLLCQDSQGVEWAAFVSADKRSG
jgi:hypothetical protein